MNKEIEEKFNKVFRQMSCSTFHPGNGNGSGSIDHFLRFDSYSEDDEIIYYSEVTIFNIPGERKEEVIAKTISKEELESKCRY